MFEAEFLLPLLGIISSAILLGIALFNALGGPHLKRYFKKADQQPFVSVLVPARNEAENIATCLDSLLKQKYNNYEIIVLDDHSEDETAIIVKKYTQKFDKVSLVQGENLSEGWLGKNWACWQLANKAKGDLFVFTDADTSHSENALNNTVTIMSKHKLDGFSVFSQQITKTFNEKLIVPLIDLIVYGLLPLWSVLKIKSALFSAANGQWIAFRKKSYFAFGGHQSVRNCVVEDVEIFKSAKKTKLNVLTASGTGMVFCRMYNSFSAIWNGLSKFLFGLSGNNSFVYFLVIFFFFFLFLFPFILLFILNSIFLIYIWLTLIILFRITLAISYKHPLFLSTILFPVGIFLLLIIAINSYIKTKTGKLTWKNRKIILDKA